MRLDCNRIVFDEPVVWIHQIFERDKMCEAPVVLLTVQKDVVFNFSALGVLENVWAAFVM